MGYYLTTDPENLVPQKSWATPKTHVPGSPVNEHGYRYYQPEVGRWCSRDPMEDVSFLVTMQIPFASSIRSSDASSFSMYQPTELASGCGSCKFMSRNTQPECSQSTSLMSEWQSKNAPSYVFVNNSPVLLHDVLGLTCAADYSTCLSNTSANRRSCESRGRMFCGTICAIYARLNPALWRRCEQRCYAAYDAACQVQANCDHAWCDEKKKQCDCPTYTPLTRYRWCGSGSDPWP